MRSHKQHRCGVHRFLQAPGQLRRGQLQVGIRRLSGVVALDRSFAVPRSAKITAVPAFAGVDQYPERPVPLIQSSQLPQALRHYHPSVWATTPNPANETVPPGAWWRCAVSPAARLLALSHRLAESVPAVSTSCPAPLVVPPADDPRAETVSVTGCSLPCPFPMFDRAELDNHYRFQFIVSVLGAVVAIFMALTWQLLPKFQRIPVVGHFWVGACLGPSGTLLWSLSPQE